MSGIAAIYNRDGKPVTATVLNRFARSLEHRGSEANRYRIHGATGLAFSPLCTTAESLAEAQPFEDLRTGCAIVLDGRVDNRDEIASALKHEGRVLTGSGDAELILSAYLCWGGSCPARILGDFSFAIWDPRHNKLFCARDPLGIKPFYYYHDAKLLLCASELRQILDHPSISTSPNEGLAAEYLACAMVNVEETLYRGIYRLPPAHSLSVTAERVEAARYFDINPNHTIRYANDEEYAEHFLELFSEAVRCRLRTHKPVGVFLSGGLDSSSVAAMAGGILGRTTAPRQPLESFSLVFPGAECDESFYIGEVGATCGIPSNPSGPAHKNAAHYLEQVRNYRDFPDYPNGVMTYSLNDLARRKDVRVVLTGLGGDEWLMGSFYQYADLLRQFRFGDILRKLRGNARAAGKRFCWRTVLRFGLWPLLPAAAQHMLGGFLNRGRIPSWIEPGFAARNKLSGRLREEPATPPFPTLAQKDLYDVLASGWRIHALEMEDRAAASFGIEQRHPFCDRRLLEFALALPEEQRWRGSETKYILRKAMAPLLPESVRQRRTKAEFSSIFMKTFVMNGGQSLFHALPIATAGWVRQEEVERKYSNMEAEHRSGDHRYTRHTCPLWMIFGVNLWVEAMFGSRNSSPNLVENLST